MPTVSPPKFEGDSKVVTVSTVQTSMRDGTVPTTKSVQLKRNPPSYSYGKPTEGRWEEVSNTQEAKVGDVVRVTYRMRIPFFQKWQMDRFVSKMQEDSRFQLRYVAMSEEESTIWVEARLLQNFSPLLFFAIAAAAIGVGIGILISVNSIERLGVIETPLGKTNIIGVVTLVVTGVAALAAVKALKK